MTIQVTVTVHAPGRTSETSIQALIRDVERIKSYDGTVVRVITEHAPVSMFPGRQPLYQVIEQMLAEADAATSPHYRASPKGLPYAIRVRAAMQVFNSASPEFRRAAERRSMGSPARNRQDFMRQNPDFVQRFYRSKGLETEFLRALAANQT